MLTFVRRSELLPNYKMVDKHGRARLEEVVSKLGIGLRGLIRYCNLPEASGGLGRWIGTIAAIRAGEEKGIRERLKMLTLEELKELRR